MTLSDFSKSHVKYPHKDETIIGMLIYGNLCAVQLYVQTDTM